MKGYDRKLFTGIVFILLLFLPVLGSAIYSLNKVISAQNRISKYADQLLVAGDLRRLKTQQLSLMPIYVLRGDEAVLVEMNKATTTFIETAKKLTTMTVDEEKKKLLAEIEKDQLALQSLAQPGIEMRQKGASATDVNTYFGRVSGPVTMAIMSKLDQLVQKITDDYEIEKTNNDKMSRTIISSLVFASALSVLLSLLVGSLLVKLIRQKEAFDKNNEVLTEKERALSNARKETVEVVAHDLKNPLASILMSTQMTLKREKNNPDQHLDSISNLERTMRSAQSMKRLIDDLLDHAKIESGSLTLDKKECDIEMLIKTLSSRFEPIAQSKNLLLRCETPLHLPKVHMDEGRIEQVITNFVGNAMKFTQSGGFIKITADVQDKNLVISVSDNGPGMHQEQMDHVFERYWQVRETAKKGTGLGLAISKAIVLAHNGKIRVKSEVGKGSTFYFSIPLSDEFKYNRISKDYSGQYLHS